MTDQEKLIELVIEEATLLRTEASHEERQRIRFSDLKPDDPFLCIYGQMTGDCYSFRAEDLITSCCKLVFRSGGNGGMSEFNMNNLGNVPNEINIKRRHFYSPIEQFIDIWSNQKNGNNAALIAFLRGETDTLTLSTDF